MLSYKNKGQLAREFDLSPKTFKKRLANLDIFLPSGHGVSPRYQKLVYEYLWYPEGVEEIDYLKVKLPDGFEGE